MAEPHDLCTCAGHRHHTDAVGGDFSVHCITCGCIWPPKTSGGTEDGARGSDVGPRGRTPGTPAAPAPAPHIAVDELIDQAIDASDGDHRDYRTTGEIVRDALGDPAKRAVVAAWLIDVGFLVECEDWQARFADSDVPLYRIGGGS